MRTRTADTGARRGSSPLTLPAETNSITITSFTYNLGQSGALLAAPSSRSGCTADGASGSTSPVAGTCPEGGGLQEKSVAPAEGFGYPLPLSRCLAMTMRCTWFVPS